MKAKQHLRTGFLLWLFVFLICFFAISNPSIQDYTTGVLIAILPFYMIGLILPDSDSENKGATIFHTVFFPIAYACRFVEKSFAHKHGYHRGHRQFLHTIRGIFYTSIVVAIITVLLLIIFKTQYTTWIFWGVVSVASTFFGQGVHLIQDNI